MAKKQLICEVITPEKVVYDGEVDMVIAPGVDGELGILPLHTPLITSLGVGELRLKIGDEQEHIAIGGGYLEVQEDKVVVLADTAELAAEIDIERARRAKERAEKDLTEFKRQKKVEFIRAESDLERAVNRIRVAGRAAR